jgi:hypothetical protein
MNDNPIGQKPITLELARYVYPRRELSPYFSVYLDSIRYKLLRRTQHYRVSDTEPSFRNHIDFTTLRLYTKDRFPGPCLPFVACGSILSRRVKGSGVIGQFMSPA